MRRQNYEFQVSSPRVIYKEINGKRYEPIELLIDRGAGRLRGRRHGKARRQKGRDDHMGTRDTGVTHLEFKIPARGLMGYRQEFLTDTTATAS